MQDIVNRFYENGWQVNIGKDEAGYFFEVVKNKFKEALYGYSTRENAETAAKNYVKGFWLE